MGQNQAEKCGFTCKVVGECKNETTSEDTQTIAKAIVDAGVDLLVFCGGDGTTRDILKASDLKVPVLGVPTGVKMHSAVFAVSPQAAAQSCLRLIYGIICRFGKQKLWMLMSSSLGRGICRRNSTVTCLVPLSRI